MRHKRLQHIFAPLNKMFHNIKNVPHLKTTFYNRHGIRSRRGLSFLVLPSLSLFLMWSQSSLGEIFHFSLRKRLFKTGTFCCLQTWYNMSMRPVWDKRHLLQVLSWKGPCYKRQMSQRKAHGHLSTGVFHRHTDTLGNAQLSEWALHCSSCSSFSKEPGAWERWQGKRHNWGL